VTGVGRDVPRPAALEVGARHASPLHRVLEGAAARPGLAMALIFLVALAVRLVAVEAVVGFDSPPVYDEMGYDLLGRSVLAGHGLDGITGGPTASRVPGYPAFLALVYGVAGPRLDAVRLVQAVIAAGTCVLLFLVGRAVAGSAVGLVAAAGAVFHPLLLYLAGLVYSETLALAFAVAASFAAVRVAAGDAGRRRPVVAGGLYGLAALTSPLMALIAPALGVGLVAAHGVRRGLPAALLLGLGFALVLAPWTARNGRVLGAIVPLSSLAGSNFWSGNNALADGGFVYPDASTWATGGGDGPPPDREYLGWAAQGEAASSTRFLAASLAWIRREPAAWLALLPRKLVGLWSPVSYGRQFSRQATWRETLVIVPPYAAFLAVAAYGAFASRRLWPRTLPLWAAVASCNLAALLYYGATRYSVGMVPSLVVFAAVGSLALAARATGAASAVGPAGGRAP